MNGLEVLRAAAGPELDLPESAWYRLDAYAQLLLEFAAPLGLVGFGAESVAEQIGRSLVLLPLVRDAGRVIDVGSGAGLPGVPLAIAAGGMTFLEPRRRAVAFLERVVRDLRLGAVVVPEPAEVAGRGPLRESAGAVVARLLAPPPVAAELCAPLCAVGGVVILTTSPEDEGPAPEALRALGLEPARTVTLDLGGGGLLDIAQRVHMMSKSLPTSPKYPRRPGSARRRPL